MRRGFGRRRAGQFIPIPTPNYTLDEEVKDENSEPATKRPPPKTLADIFADVKPTHGNVVGNLKADDDDKYFLKSPPRMRTVSPPKTPPRTPTRNLTARTPPRAKTPPRMGTKSPVRSNSTVIARQNQPPSFKLSLESPEPLKPKLEDKFKTSDEIRSEIFDLHMLYLVTGQIPDAKVEEFTKRINTLVNLALNKPSLFHSLEVVLAIRGAFVTIATDEGMSAEIILMGLKMLMYVFRSCRELRDAHTHEWHDRLETELFEIVVNDRADFGPVQEMANEVLRLILHPSKQPIFNQLVESVKAGLKDEMDIVIDVID
ncbi:hypothetical protein WR25_10729 [Diploscapter pachys]|uniref:Uncharacterized protein n=1 Tax=Diploscapter pachys TaxID=2018661 RepID=A0A2A2KMM5_9BILA|nr:hypothetical protein WR25_10729 [Diploscapter pachys]